MKRVDLQCFGGPLVRPRLSLIQDQLLYSSVATQPVALSLLTFAPEEFRGPDVLVCVLVFLSPQSILYWRMGARVKPVLLFYCYFLQMCFAAHCGLKVLVSYGRFYCTSVYVKYPI